MHFCFLALHLSHALLVRVCFLLRVVAACMGACSPVGWREATAVPEPSAELAMLVGIIEGSQDRISHSTGCQHYAQSLLQDCNSLSIWQCPSAVSLQLLQLIAYRAATEAALEKSPAGTVIEVRGREFANAVLVDSCDWLV